MQVHNGGSMEFRYNMPVKVYFGRGCVLKNAAEFTPLGRKALVMTGRSSADRNGSYGDVAAALEQQGIAHERYSSVEPNPTVENVREAAAAAKSWGADFIVGIGGGSPLDAAKAAAVLAVNDIDDDTLFSGRFENRPLPIAAVPTTAGTGSEVTPYSILTFKKISNKKSFASDSVFPVVALLDPVYTHTLGMDSTINTAVDALSHSVESYLSARATEAVKPAAIESISLLARCFGTLRRHELPTEGERELLLYASMLAGTCIAQTATTAVHAMGYPLTYYRDIDHGRANGLVMHGYMEFVSRGNRKAVDVLDAMKIESLDEFGLLMRDLLGEPEKLTEGELELFTETASSSKNLANTIPRPEPEDIRGIFRRSFGM